MVSTSTSLARSDSIASYTSSSASPQPTISELFVMFAPASLAQRSTSIERSQLQRASRILRWRLGTTSTLWAKTSARPSRTVVSTSRRTPAKSPTSTSTSISGL